MPAAGWLTGCGGMVWCGCLASSQRCGLSFIPSRLQVTPCSGVATAAAAAPLVVVATVQAGNSDGCRQEAARALSNLSCNNEANQGVRRWAGWVWGKGETPAALQSPP